MSPASLGGLGSSAFRGASRASLMDLRSQLASATADPELGREMFAVAGLLEANLPLRRALTDVARSGDDRAALLGGLLGEQVSATGRGLAEAAVRSTWSRLRDLTDALEYLGVLAEVIAAEHSGPGLDELEDELFRFGRIVENTPALRAALSDRTIDPERRVGLAEDLLGGHADEATIRLVRQAVRVPHGRPLLDVLGSYADIAAAWRDRLVATVRAAVRLSTAEQERLADVLARRFGRQVQLNIAVDSTVVGGLRIEIGDEVIDGTIAARLDDARRRLVG